MEKKRGIEERYYLKTEGRTESIKYEQIVDENLLKSVKKARKKRGLYSRSATST